MRTASLDSANPMQSTNTVDGRRPIVTFVIPSTLSRDTLNRTMKSLMNQNEPNWNAVVGVDERTANLTADEIQLKSKTFLQDHRVLYVPISTSSDFRGERKDRQNGAGEVRNEIIFGHSNNRSDWVAFVDDDDTLSPYYVKDLSQGINNTPHADVIVFRMRDVYGGIIPPSNHLKLFKVGISFAVRRELFFRNDKALAFEPSAWEDFFFLKKADQANCSIYLSSCATYFVNQHPNVSLLDTEYAEPCRFIKTGIQ